MSCMAGPSGDVDKSPSRDDLIPSGDYSCYPDPSTNAEAQNLRAHLHGFGPPGPEIYNLISSGMDNMIGFLPKNPHSTPDASFSWKSSFFARQCPPSSNPKDQIVNQESAGFYPQHDMTELLDQSSLRSCVFPCEGNERPSHGLSLSLNPSNPSSIGLQSFELRQHDLFRFGPSSSRPESSHNMQQQAFVRNSRYLGPAQELLQEFCDLGSNHEVNGSGRKMKDVLKEDGEWGESEINADKRQSLYSLNIVELQRRKSKLLQMLEEVERRYKHYCDQMRGVTSSFESVAGNGAARAYSALASKAMSRHFRCLKDGILSQIKATKKAMGEKDSSAPGTVKGETPRLRILDQTIRQQRALQQMSNMEIHPWRPQRGLPERSVSVSNWFINARVRLWKPMVEEMYLEELKEENPQNDEGPSVNHNRPEDQKPTDDQLGRVDPGSLSSVIGRSKQPLQSPEFGRVGPTGDAFGFGFPPSHGGGGVSLTLGLHQHGNLPFSPLPQGAMFYGREQGMEECQVTVQYSSTLLDGESQNPPYRNLMGAQLLHDLAG
ncbi:Bel1 homeotic protein [Striga asiatica]|uniref:Bel1 homeotic protein n=1 Tax=Striga asiatica TaxID=4170 RepID=A0A5A7PJV7_STRAF|nr:Bel1 homeotic protein [Striga asiatica]